jgi:hypothetical protein
MDVAEFVFMTTIELRAKTPGRHKSAKENPMANDFQIIVTYDATTTRLTVESEKLTLPADTSPIHSLVWFFDGVEPMVAAGWLPGIEFASEDEKTTRYAGPFTNLCCTSSSVIACGNVGQSDTYRYRAVLKPAAGSGLQEIRSEPAHLDNQVKEPTAAAIQVRRHPDHENLLQVSPQDVTLVTGQSILWEVDEELRDIPDWYPRLVFVDGPVGMNSHCGPFASLDTRDQGILGAGSSGQGPTLYNYVFQMVNLEDNTVRFESSPDPTIDDEGDPPKTTP